MINKYLLVGIYSVKCNVFNYIAILSNVFGLFHLFNILNHEMSFYFFF